MRKKVKILAALLVLVVTGFTANLNAQEEEKESLFSVGVDFYSSYVWRGTKFGGPSVQPSLKLEKGGLTAGIWGAYGTKTDPSTGLLAAYTETDPYISYSFPFGLGIGLTDYYYEGDFTELSDSVGNHAFEVNLGYSIGSLSISGNYIINEAGGAGSAGGDMYFQIGYDFTFFSLFAGAGNGWHTLDDENGDDVFNVCNIGISTSKTIEVTEKFSIPITGQLIVNPDSKQIFAVVGLSF